MEIGHFHNIAWTMQRSINSLHVIAGWSSRTVEQYKTDILLQPAPTDKYVNKDILQT